MSGKFSILPQNDHIRWTKKIIRCQCAFCLHVCVCAPVDGKRCAPIQWLAEKAMASNEQHSLAIKMAKSIGTLEETISPSIVIGKTWSCARPQFLDTSIRIACWRYHHISRAKNSRRAPKQGAVFQHVSTWPWPAAPLQPRSRSEYSRVKITIQIASISVARTVDFLGNQIREYREKMMILGKKSDSKTRPYSSPRKRLGVPMGTGALAQQ